MPVAGQLLLNGLEARMIAFGVDSAETAHAAARRYLLVDDSVTCLVAELMVVTVEVGTDAVVHE